ncbi:MAG TPA: hypothetical protein VIM73_16590, partial [Polyangiaceae bacterium]
RLRRDVTASAVVCGSALLLACAGNGPKEVEAPRTAVPRASNKPGTSLKNPVLRCGPEESYRYVADEFVCPSGENPFDGDLVAARKARRGSDENPDNGHVVDIYRVPCNSGSVHLFVDLYGCEQYQRRLISGNEQSRELGTLVARYEALDFKGVAQHCAHADESMPPDEASECMTLLPASLVMLGRPEAGVGFLGELCSSMPQPSSLSDVRAHMVIRTVAFVDHARELAGAPLSDEEGSYLLGAFAAACSVTPADIERYVQTRETL